MTDPSPSSPSLFDRLKTSLTGGSTPEMPAGKLDAIRQVSQKFMEGGCESISSAGDRKLVQDYTNLPTAGKLAVGPDRNVLNTAAQCPAPKA